MNTLNSLDANQMLKRNILLFIPLIGGLLISGFESKPAHAQQYTPDKPVVQIIMFWLKTCGHCDYIINEVLPPIKERYGDGLEILLIELVTQEDVDSLYETANILGIPKERVGVPFMIIGEGVLSGSQQIPMELPGLIETHLASGGLEYPNLPSLAKYLPQSGAEVIESSESLVEEEQPSITATAVPMDKAPASDESLLSSTNGFTLAGIVLAGLGIALIISIFAILKSGSSLDILESPWLNWMIPVLALLGMGVAGYLVYVETASVQAFCGPVGDCNAVQNSSYAKIWGVLPVGVLGLIGYLGILIAWIIQEVRTDRWADYAKLGILCMAVFGTLYSIYLTYLEIWVIRAVCVWCLTSAVLVALLMVFSVQPANLALDTLAIEDE